MADFNSINESLNEFRISINSILEKCLKESHALDTNILCVIPGKIVYKIIIEINIIKNDGNVFDAAVIAALVSWLNFKIPFFRVKNGELYYDTFINLTTIHMPVCVTFGIFEKKDEKVEFVVDNTLEEESIMKGSVSICANIFGEISYMKMDTEAMIGVDEIQDLIGEVDKHVLDIHKKIKKFVEDENKRVDKIIKEGKLENNDNVLMKDEKENDHDMNRNDLEKMKNIIIKKMDVEENIGNNINILEFKK
jgi:exosome complex component RRP45